MGVLKIIFKMIFDGKFLAAILGMLLFMVQGNLDAVFATAVAYIALKVLIDEVVIVRDGNFRYPFTGIEILDKILAYVISTRTWVAAVAIIIFFVSGGNFDLIKNTLIAWMAAMGLNEAGLIVQKYVLKKSNCVLAPPAPPAS